MYKSLGSKAYTIGKALGGRALSVATLGSKVNPLSHLGNMAIKKGIEIGAHKLMSSFTPTNQRASFRNTKRIK